mgnify:CR=1 FL=1
MDALITAFGMVFDPGTVLVMLGASLFGLFVGAVPGLTATMATALLVPVFFVRMGMLVHVENFVKPGVIGFALLLTAAAMVGKWACGLATPRGGSRATVGLGMMPRGEVGLIFADVGRRSGILTDDAFSIVLLMVMGTTFVAPPLLKLLFRDVRAELAAPPVA